MKHQGPFVNLVLQGRVPVPQTPFLGVLGLWYIRESHSEGHRGPKSASRAKSPITDFVAAIEQLENFSITLNCPVTPKIRVLCDPSAPIPPQARVRPPRPATPLMPATAMPHPTFLQISYPSLVFLPPRPAE